MDRLAKAVGKSRRKPAGIPRRKCAPEKIEENWCDDCVLRAGGKVIRFSQGRETRQTPGIPDRLYRLCGVTFWWEVKPEDGHLTAEQLGFLRDELDGLRPAGCGTAHNLAQFLAAVLAVSGVEQRRRQALVAGELAVTAWQVRGLRGVPTSRHPTRRQRDKALAELSGKP